MFYSVQETVTKMTSRLLIGQPIASFVLFVYISFVVCCFIALK